MIALTDGAGVPEADEKKDEVAAAVAEPSIVELGMGDSVIRSDRLARVVAEYWALTELVSLRDALLDADEDKNELALDDGDAETDVRIEFVGGPDKDTVFVTEAAVVADARGVKVWTGEPESPNVALD